ncbi:hypothetical protein DSECCO2_658510 [anaerobic digester metagenome]
MELLDTGNNTTLERYSGVINMEEENKAARIAATSPIIIKCLRQVNKNIPRPVESNSL